MACRFHFSPQNQNLTQAPQTNLTEDLVGTKIATAKQEIAANFLIKKPGQPTYQIDYNAIFHCLQLLGGQRGVAEILRQLDLTEDYETELPQKVAALCGLFLTAKNAPFLGELLEQFKESPQKQEILLLILDQLLPVTTLRTYLRQVLPVETSATIPPIIGQLIVENHDSEMVRLLLNRWRLMTKRGLKKNHEIIEELLDHDFCSAFELSYNQELRDFILANGFRKQATLPATLVNALLLQGDGRQKDYVLADLRSIVPEKELFDEEWLPNLVKICQLDGNQFALTLPPAVLAYLLTPPSNNRDDTDLKELLNFIATKAPPTYLADLKNCLLDRLRTSERRVFGWAGSLLLQIPEPEQTIKEFLPYLEKLENTIAEQREVPLTVANSILPAQRLLWRTLWAELLAQKGEVSSAQQEIGKLFPQIIDGINNKKNRKEIQKYLTNVLAAAPFSKKTLIESKLLLQPNALRLWGHFLPLLNITPALKKAYLEIDSLPWSFDTSDETRQAILYSFLNSPAQNDFWLPLFEKSRQRFFTNNYLNDFLSFFTTFDLPKSKPEPNYREAIEPIRRRLFCKDCFKQLHQLDQTGQKILFWFLGNYGDMADAKQLTNLYSDTNRFRFHHGEAMFAAAQIKRYFAKNQMAEKID